MDGAKASCSAQDRVQVTRANADYTKSALVKYAENEWVATPVAGVERRILDRYGKEKARATSMVRYAPGTKFTKHTHKLGEEFIVLEGNFCDHTGDHLVGSYLRNADGSTHEPFVHEDEGGIIFVKLRQMDPVDEVPCQTAIHTSDPKAWVDGPQEGQRIAHLYENSTKTEVVRLEEWKAGSTIEWTRGNGGEEIFVISGDFSDGADSYVKYDWQRHPPSSAGSKATFTTKAGCKVYVKSGHLDTIIGISEDIDV